MTATAPRPPATLAALATLLAILVLVLLGAPVPAGAQDGGGPDRVLIVSIPRLTWQQVADEEPPALTDFLAESAVGNLSLRTIGPRTNLGEAYATIGAGNRAGARDGDAGRLLAPDDRIESGTAADAFTRRTGHDPGDAALLQMSIADIQGQNDRYGYAAEPGALGTALEGEEVPVALVGNADLQVGGRRVVFDPSAPTAEAEDGASEEGIGLPPSSPIVGTVEPVEGENRPAGLAVMTEEGTVATGDASRDLLTDDPGAPFGTTLDAGSVLDALDAHWADDGLALVELSDLERADAYRSLAVGAQADALARDALARTDALLAEVLARTGPDDLVVVVSPAAPRSGETLTPMAIRGPGFGSGTLVSGTTRRDGYVTLPDLAPTVLDELGIDQPSSMTGALIAASNDGDLSDDRIDGFLTANEATAFRDDLVEPITVLVVALLVVLYGIGVAALVRSSDWLRRGGAALGLWVMGIPVTTFLLGFLPMHEWGGGVYLVAMLGGAALLAVGARIAGRGERDHRRRAVRTTLVPVALTYLVLLVDVVLLDGRLQINTIFGYSPVVAGRFAGFGNPAYALFSMGAVLLACGGWTLFDGERPGPHRRALVAGIVALFAVTVVVDGHPALGSDVGGVLSIIPTAFLVVWLLLGRRLRPRVVVGAVVATVAAVAVFAAVDLARPESERSHLGRLVEGSGDGGSGLLTTVERKITANLTILTTSIWTLTIPLALVLLVLLTMRRPRLLDDRLPDDATTRATLWGGICMCVLGMAVNDSGIAVPAVMFTLFLPFVMHQVLTDPIEGTPGTGAVDGDDGGDIPTGAAVAPDDERVSAEPSASVAAPEAGGVT